LHGKHVKRRILGSCIGTGRKKERLIAAALGRKVYRKKEASSQRRCRSKAVE
jgi:hypothetical protein